MPDYGIGRFYWWYPATLSLKWSVHCVFSWADAACSTATYNSGLILQVHIKGDERCHACNCTHSHHSPVAWLCVIIEHTVFIRANLHCWETLFLIQLRTFPFKHHPSLSLSLLGPLSFEKRSRVFKKWTGSWAIQGVSNAMCSAKLLDAKQTVGQIKIKGSNLACLPRCPHMPSGAVTVSHGHAASVLMLTPLLLTTSGLSHQHTLWQSSTLTDRIKTRQRLKLFVRAGQYCPSGLYMALGAKWGFSQCLGLFYSLLWIQRCWLCTRSPWKSLLFQSRTFMDSSLNFTTVLLSIFIHFCEQLLLAQLTTNGTSVITSKVCLFIFKYVHKLKQVHAPTPPHPTPTSNKAKFSYITCARKAEHSVCSLSLFCHKWCSSRTLHLNNVLAAGAK